MIVSVVVVIALYLWARWCILRGTIFPDWVLSRLTTKQWIPFRKLVNPDTSFQPCPNCGEESLATPAFGGCLPMYCDPICKSCDYHFKPERRWWKFLKGFRIMSHQDYSALTN
ncbi:hypothetical protein AMJ47_03495 [Parcubacteria bacterium DG_72]|nr:MAG: hypothetical protein AMJ47_03495 [Parcubacteria bacterium DG_72]